MSRYVWASKQMAQIKEGEHIHRALVAHTTMYLALYQLNIERFLEENPKIRKDLREGGVNVVIDVSKCQKETETRGKVNHKNFM